ncbi:uncharacterized protein LOC122537490 [Frieseomelitta varia]|uniref:uncharacterized protein LOC122537490 n=1 Tax=Frieseomelitta varia TaxID=561572 RepID=UPI001CB68AB4|nr:uncharacterized protein LOC122537490 [Frieseomelitta varia]
MNGGKLIFLSLSLVVLLQMNRFVSSSDSSNALSTFRTLVFPQSVTSNTNRITDLFNIRPVSEAKTYNILPSFLLSSNTPSSNPTAGNPTNDNNSSNSANTSPV